MGGQHYQRNRKQSLIKFQNIIKFKFKDKCLLNRALTHRSYTNEISYTIKDNERLEYLGDSVLALVVNEYLFKRYESYHEGDLAKIKSAVVSEDMLAQIAEEINLGNYILLGKGEEHSGGRSRPSILANTMEALLGAMYLDSGLKKTKTFTLFLLKKHIESIDRLPYIRDPKTMLQELVQKKYKEKPEYRIIKETGPDHSKHFIVSLIVHGKEIGQGKGTSKRRAEIDAARKILNNIHEGSFKI
jgi:ribonuclease-3